MTQSVRELDDGYPPLVANTDTMTSDRAQRSSQTWRAFPDGTLGNRRTTMYPSSELNDGFSHRLPLDNVSALPHHRTGDPTKIQQPDSVLGASKQTQQQGPDSDRTLDSQQHTSDAHSHDTSSPTSHEQQLMAAGGGFEVFYFPHSPTGQAYFFDTDYDVVENSYRPSRDWQDEAPNNHSGQPTEHRISNHTRVPDIAHDMNPQVGVPRKKRSHEELDADRSSEPSTRGSDYGRLIQDQQPAASDLGPTPQGYGSRRSQALLWDVVEGRKQLKDKKRRLGSGDSFPVSTTVPENYPSARHRPDGPDTSIDPVARDQAVVPGNPTLPRPRAIPSTRRQKKTPKTRTRRDGSKKKRRYHGELAKQSDNTLIFREDGKYEWEPTAYHEDMRREMIKEMAEFGKYRETPAAGPMKYDVTAFNPTQQDWRFQGHQGWDSSQDSLMYRFERRRRTDPSYEPGPLRFHDHVILNQYGDVITAWRDIPLTVSSAVEGGRLENIQRTDSRITVQDFQDRMPSMVTATQKLQLRSAFTNRMLRYRLANGLASWHPREGSQFIKDLMLRHLTKEQITRNTTKGFLGLTSDERKEIEEENKRTQKYKNRAGGRSKQAKKSVLESRTRKDDVDGSAVSTDDEEIRGPGDYAEEEERDFENECSEDYAEDEEADFEDQFGHYSPE